MTGDPSVDNYEKMDFSEQLTADANSELYY
jgi:hypothetical protein